MESKDVEDESCQWREVLQAALNSGPWFSDRSVADAALGTWKAFLLTGALDPAESSPNLNPLKKIRIGGLG